MLRVAVWAIGLVGPWPILGPSVSAAEPLHHDLTVVLNPSAGELTVDDTITLPPAVGHHGAYHFTLHEGWEPIARDRGVRMTRSARASQDGVETYAVSVSPKQRSFSVAYGGPLSPAADSAGSAEHSDWLSRDGVVLSHESRWYPVFGDEPVTFSLTVRGPAGWEVVSQGRRTVHRRHDDGLEVRWESPEPQDEMYVVGGPLIEYARDTGGITAMAFLRTPDADLAEAYLDATGRYLALYAALLGPYPYPKFAMVENARETGFGMPSFTLLGSTVIRLPFILHSSYPHEILHNWWGNGVFVDASRGNWAEGLTAYLADHLIAEQRGGGAEYRRAALQRYADYVTHDRDFPLVEFKGRHSPASQAVGYDKALMAFHMTRLRLGDEAFLGGLRGFFEAFRFRRATFADLDRAFARVAGHASGPLAPWTERTGAPKLTVSNAETSPLGDRYLLTALVEQSQPGAAYRLRVPIAVTLEGHEQAYQTTFDLRTKHRGLELVVPGRPLRLDVDPEFDLFRRLDRAELPPALSQLFGAKHVVVILPAAAPPELRDGYRRLAESLGQSSGSYEVVGDDTLDRLPRGRSIWVVGWENRFRNAMSDAADDLPLTIDDRFVRISGTELTRERHSVVVVGRLTHNPEFGIGWVASARVEALPGLARKLPHYGKYGYLGFEGPEATNVVKGEWEVARSPLSIAVKRPDGHAVEVPRARLAPRRALTAAGTFSGSGTGSGNSGGAR
jgi:hypothetical protein